MQRKSLSLQKYFTAESQNQKSFFFTFFWKDRLTIDLSVNNFIKLIKYFNEKQIKKSQKFIRLQYSKIVEKIPFFKVLTS